MRIWRKRWGVIGLCIFAGGGAWAAMSQVPLTGSTGSVAPNLMFTLDNSTSMDLECVPDGLCVSYTGNTRVQAMPWYRGVYEAIGVVATYDSNNLFARRMRSAGTNPAYYNPRVRYRAWMRANGSRYPEYPPGAAPDNPNFPTDNLVNLVATQTVSAVWTPAVIEGYTRLTQPATTETIWPAQYYDLKAGSSGDSLGDFTQVIIAPGNTYPKDLNRTDCAGANSCTYEEEAQNFSNWYTYARNRIKVAIGGTSEAFAAVPSAFRVGYGTINTPASPIDGGDPLGTIIMGVRPFSLQNREKFYDLLQHATMVSGTPLRRAMDDVGRYFSRKGTGSPWASDPSGASGAAGAVELSCRRAFHVLMTDGIWNDGNGNGTPSAATNTEVDSLIGPEISHPDGKTKYQYKPAAPFAGGGNPSLADVAMYYWNHDLRDDLANDVPQTDGDPAFWQHLVNYTIGLAITGTLSNPGDLKALTAGTKSWGSPLSGRIDNVDDLWHAAINSRGGSANARSAEEYTGALKSMIQAIVGAPGREAGVAVSGRSYSAESSVKFIPSYKPGDWTGEVEAQRLSDGSTLWSASKALPKAEVRNIYTLSPDSVGVPFTASAMNTATQNLLSATDPAKLINYVRGDQTEEKNSYRKRISLLGDIVNSTPVLVKDLVDSQYDFLPSTTPGQSSYLKYLKSKRVRTPQLFVGANDGMLHAFNADSGIESFAFVPRSVLGQLKELANPIYDHRYFVDGPVTEVDMYDTAAAKWRNLVVGTGGAGAKNLFAINVPVPSVPESGDPPALDAKASAPGAADILWEINSATPGYEDLHHVLQAPESGIMQDGTWAIITGNGVGPDVLGATLYVINARTGERIAALTAQTIGGGLGGVKVVRDSNKRIVAAYAGDLVGYLWKFDLSSPDRSKWSVNRGGPLLLARDSSGAAVEPFTAAPAVIPHPLGGFMVLAGTGKLFEPDDASSTSEQSLYGVWDKPPKGSYVDQAKGLVTQTISPLTINGQTGEYFAISSNAVDYGAAAKNMGWKIRLTIAPGQRLIYAPQIESGRVLFDTMVPGGTATGCTATQPQGYTFVLDPFTGAPSQDGPTFDTNHDGLFNASDDVTAAVMHFSSIGQRRVVGVNGSSEVRLEGPGTASDRQGSDSTTKAKLGTTRVKRQWRQIATPPSY